MKEMSISTILRYGKYWIIDILTLRVIETFPPFDTYAEAVAVICNQPDLEDR